MQLNKSKKHKATLETYGILDGIYCIINELPYYHITGPLTQTKRILKSFYDRSERGLQDLYRW